MWPVTTTLESVSNLQYASGTFGVTPTALRKDNYPFMSPIKEGIDYEYDKPLDDSGLYNIYDYNNAMNFDEGKYFSNTSCKPTLSAAA